MKLITKHAHFKIPRLYSSAEKPPEKVTVWAKYFLPESNMTWYVTEANAVVEDAEYGSRHASLRQVYDHKLTLLDVIFFGYVVGQEAELGYFYLSELEKLRSKQLKMPVERDRHWKPKTLRSVMNMHDWNS